MLLYKKADLPNSDPYYRFVHQKDTPAYFPERALPCSSVSQLMMISVAEEIVLATIISEE